VCNVFAAVGPPRVMAPRPSVGPFAC